MKRIDPKLEQRVVEEAKKRSGREIAKTLGISASSVTNILKRNGVQTTIGRRPSRAIDHTAFDVLTPESTYWIGFLFADGCIDRSNGSPQIILDLAVKDRTHVEKFRTFLKSDHAITEVTHKARKIVNTSVAASKSCAFRVRSKTIADALLRVGFTQKGPDRTPTPEIANSPDFWRGVVDGDGTVRIHIDPRRGYRFAHLILCGHIPLLERYLAFLQQEGVFANLIDTSSGIYQVRLMGAPAAIAIRALYENAVVVLDRKFKNACEALRLHSR